MQVLYQENKEIILLRDTNCEILQKYWNGDILSNNLPINSMPNLEFYNLFGFQQLIETGPREALLSSNLLDHIFTACKSNLPIHSIKHSKIYQI